MLTLTSSAEYDDTVFWITRDVWASGDPNNTGRGVEHVIVLTLTQLVRLLLRRLFVFQRPFLCFFFVFFYILCLFFFDFLFLVFSF